jgi:Mrp family chromosome partitioning ATPase
LTRATLRFASPDDVWPPARAIPTRSDVSRDEEEQFIRVENVGPEPAAGRAEPAPFRRAATERGMPRVLSPPPVPDPAASRSDLATYVPPEQSDKVTLRALLQASVPGAVMTRVIQVSESSQGIVTTEGETVYQPRPPDVQHSPRTVSSFDPPGQVVGSHRATTDVSVGPNLPEVQQTTLARRDVLPSNATSGLVVSSGNQALVSNRADARPTVQRALQAAIQALEGVRDGSEHRRPSSDVRVHQEAARSRSVAVERTPALPLSERELLSAIDTPQSARAESFRVLRYRLRTLDDPRVVAVVAPRAGDEASLCAAELALAYVDAGSEHVLLVEIDTERPQLAHTLGFKVEHCFALQLCDKYDGSDEPWRAVAVFRANLHVLAINPSLSTGDRISLQAFSHALSELGSFGYGHIVISCPKALDSSDVALIQDKVDGVLLTGRMGRTTSRDLRRAAQQLKPNNILGSVLIQPA